MTAVAAPPSTLEVAVGVRLPIEFVTKACAILAQRRKGKTYTASVLAEELVAFGIPWVALDPTGAWWGLRASADGLSAGLPVVVIGGQHGDLPLERGAGAFVADLVLDYPGWYVLDLSLLESRAAEREFSAAFAKRLLRRKMQPGMDFPLHLFIDEADLFVPQEKEGRGDLEVLGAFQGIVRRGGLHGLGATLISQRPALVNKSVLTQLDLMILLRLVAGNDQDAVDKNYISRASTKDERAELMGSLASLPVGEAWFFEPGGDPPLFVRAKVRERRTFNSSATPKPGEQRVEPTVFADVDLDALRSEMSETLERMKENDPGELQRRIADLEGRLAARADGARPGNPDAVPEWDAWFRGRGWLPPNEQPVPERVEVPVASVADLDAIWKLVHETKAVGDSLVERLGAVAQPLAAAILQAVEAAEHPKPIPPPPVVPPPASERSAAADSRKAAPAAEGRRISEPQQRVLDAVAWWSAARVDWPTLSQVAFVVGNHPRSKGFTNNVSALSSAGLVERDPGTVALTSAGVAAARFPDAAPTTADLQAMIRRQVGAKRAEILDLLLREFGGQEVTLDRLAGELGVHPRSKGFTNNVSTLSGLGLVVRRPGHVRASDLCYVR